MKKVWEKFNGGSEQGRYKLFGMSSLRQVLGKVKSAKLRPKEDIIPSVQAQTPVDSKKHKKKHKKKDEKKNEQKDEQQDEQQGEQLQTSKNVPNVKK